MNINFKSTCPSFTLLFSLIAGLTFTGLVLGNPVWENAPPIPMQIYIRSDGTIEPSNVPIQKTGNTYTFTNNILNASLIVKADNIVIDGAGFLLQGTGKNNAYLNRGFFEGISLVNLKNVTIKNMTIREFDFGVMVASSSRISLVGNQVFECIRICNSSSDCQIIGNNLSRVEVQSSHNTLANNNFSLPNSHLHIEGNNNKVNGNLFHASIRIARSHHNIVSKNNMSGIGSYVEISGSSSHNEVFENEISFTDRYGLIISNSFENVIYNNTIKNTYIGIYLTDLPPSYGYVTTTNNLFYQNNLTGNTKSVHINRYMESEPGFNSWDNGKEGNYYSDYNGTDADGDGIGDTPYVINANNQDRYPLMATYDIENNTTLLPPSAPFPTAPVAAAFVTSVALAGVGVLVYFRKRKRQALTANL